MLYYSKGRKNLMEKQNDSSVEAMQQAKLQGLLFKDNGKILIDCLNKDIIEVIIPDGVVSIGEIPSQEEKDQARQYGEAPHKFPAFCYCRNLTNVIIPESVTEIGAEAFIWCDSLTNIILPKSVVKIGDFAFQRCSSLVSIIIPDGVTEIGLGVFSGCINLTTVVIPNSVKIIHPRAFKSCKKLTNVVIPDSVTEISDTAFLRAGCEEQVQRDYRHLLK